MKSTRGFILAVLVIAALAASPAAASASAGFVASEYTATLHGDDVGNVYMSIGSEEMACNGLTFGATLSKPSTSVTTSTVTNPGCTGGSFALNGCQLELRPAGKGSVDIGPSGCGPVNLSVGCATGLTISAGTRIDADYQNVGSGSEAKVNVKIDDYAEYVSSGHCVSKGTHSDLHIVGTLEITAKNAAEKSTGIKAIGGGVYLGGGKAGQLEANEYPAVITGKRLNLGPYKGKAKILGYPGGEAPEIACDTANYSDTAELVSPAKEFSLNASYSKCEWSGLGETTVSMNSCHFTYSSLEIAGAENEYKGAANIACNKGDSISIVGPGCTAKIPAQSLSKGAGFANWDVENEASVLGTTQGTSVKFTSEGPFCFLVGLEEGGSYANGSVESDMLLQADFPG